jgi:hypothetical protein
VFQSAAYWVSKSFWTTTIDPCITHGPQQDDMEHFARRISVFSVNEDSVSPKSPDGIDIEPSLQGEHAKHIRRLEEHWRFDTVDEADDDKRVLIDDDFEVWYVFDFLLERLWCLHMLLKIPRWTSDRVF